MPVVDPAETSVRDLNAAVTVEIAGHAGYCCAGMNQRATVRAAGDASQAVGAERLNAPRTASGGTWSADAVTWAANDRSHMIRIPEDGRFEPRLADGAVNPHLMPAAIPAARLDIDMYTEGHTVEDVKRLPLNLLDALRRLGESEVLAARLGAFVPAYLELREWDDYAGHLTRWERGTTLDC